MIAVEDQGRGIPAHLRERVFDKFLRATAEGAALKKMRRRGERALPP